jgi:hypothetical protein
MPLIAGKSGRRRGRAAGVNELGKSRKAFFPFFFRRFPFRYCARLIAGTGGRCGGRGAGVFCAGSRDRRRVQPVFAAFERNAAQKRAALMIREKAVRLFYFFLLASPAL